MPPRPRDRADGFNITVEWVDSIEAHAEPGVVWTERVVSDEDGFDAEPQLSDDEKAAEEDCETRQRIGWAREAADPVERRYQLERARQARVRAAGFRLREHRRQSTMTKVGVSASRRRSHRERRPAGNTARRRSGAVNSGDPPQAGDDDPPGDGGFELSFVDRAPFLWRFRALRCRYMEWREGVVE
jgi:hypothetical protein